MNTKYNILYVDDEESNLRVFKGLYRRKYNVITSTSAEDALLIFDQQQIDLVLSDQKMPRLSGLEFLAKIKEKNTLIPTILITAYTDHDVLKEAVNSNKIHKYINKPYDPGSLTAVIDLAIEGYLLNLERETMQVKLAQSEEKFRGIFNSMADVFSRIDFDGKIEIVSPSAIDLFGYTAEELIGKDVDVLYTNPNDRVGLVEKVKKLNIIRGAETSIVTKEGKQKQVSLTAKLYYDKQNKPLGIESIARDISEKKEMQELLQEQNELLDETQRLAKIGSWSYDPVSNELKCSDTLLDIYGVNNTIDEPKSLEEYLSFFQPLDQIRVRKLIAETVKYQKDFSFEASIIRADGKKLTLTFLGKINSTSDNQLKKITVACLDVTEARMREKELIKSEEKFRLLAEQLPVRVLKIDNKLNIIFANKLAYDKYYYQRKGKEKVHSFFHKNVLSQIIETINEAIENGEGSYLEYESKKRWYALKVSVVSEPRGVGNMLLFIDDITQKKESEELLKNMNLKLEGKVQERTKELEKAKDNIEKAYVKEKELGELKSQFVSTASHQFRTPLTVIQSSISLLEMQAEKESTGFKLKFDRVNNRVQSEIQRMTELMDDVLILGKKESGAEKIELQMVDILDFIQTIVQKHNDIQEDSRSIELTYEGTPILFELDPRLFEHAFSNLVSNAFKYSKSKPPPLVHLQYCQNRVIIKVQDFGVGIPKEELNNVFEPFYRASNVKSINGTGLGTSIIKAYLDLLNIPITIESELGKGSTFILKIEK